MNERLPRQEGGRGAVRGARHRLVAEEGVLPHAARRGEDRTSLAV